MLQTKVFVFDFKKTTNEGTFEGMLSPYNSVDTGGDLIEPGAYAKNLAEKGNVRPLLWAHETANPIGDLTLRDAPDGLRAKGRLLLKLPEAQKAYELAKQGIATGLSIGYRAIRDEVVNGIRHLKEIVLYEGSIVVFPMEPLAQITSVKSFDAQRIEASFAEFKTDILRALETK